MKKVRFAVISATTMAQQHMRGMRQTNNSELVAICDIREEVLNETHKSFPETRAYTNVSEMLACDDIDAVIVCTPDQSHRELSLACLAAGKHVLCEKPLAMTVEDCKVIVEAAEKSDKKFMVGQICRFTPGFMAAKKLIDDGEIGELFYVESEYAHDYSKIPGKYKEWRKDPLRHGFLGGGCHAVDLLRWIAGNPTEVAAFANHKMLTDWPTDDCTIAIMKFPNDVIGKVFVSTGCKRDYTMRSVFYGSKGTIITDNTSNHMTVYKTDSSCGFTTPMLYPISINNHNTMGEIEAFADIILNDKPVQMTAREGACTVAAALAAVRSSKSGQFEKVDYDF